MRWYDTWVLIAIVIVFMMAIGSLLLVR